MSNCTYHPNKDAVTKCERCNRLLCLQDKTVYRQSRSRGTGDSRSYYEITREYCPVCVEDAKIENAKSSKNGSMIIGVFVIFIGIISIGIFSFMQFLISSFPEDMPGPSPYVFFIPFGLIFFTILGFMVIGLIKNILSAPNEIKKAKQRQQQFVQSLSSPPKGLEGSNNTKFDNSKSSNVNLYCSSCGNSLSLKDRFCSHCGDTTEDEKQELNVQ